MQSFLRNILTHRVAPARPLTRTVKRRLADLTRPVGTEDLMAVDYPRPRVRVSLQDAAGVLAALLVFLGLWLCIQRPWQSADSPPDLSAFTDYGYQDGGAVQESGGSSAARQSASPEELVVSVVGAVNHAGLVTLTPGARVAEALQRAELTGDASVEAVNLAEKVRDGQQILVPSGDSPPAQAVQNSPPSAQGTSTGHLGAGAGGSAPGLPVSLNSASAADLEKLPGVGEKTAAAIVDYRNTHGPFTDVEQLEEVKGIGPAKVEALKGAVTV